MMLVRLGSVGVARLQVRELLMRWVQNLQEAIVFHVFPTEI